MIQQKRQKPSFVLVLAGHRSQAWLKGLSCLCQHTSADFSGGLLSYPIGTANNEHPIQAPETCLSVLPICPVYCILSLNLLSCCHWSFSVLYCGGFLCRVSLFMLFHVSTSALSETCSPCSSLSMEAHGRAESPNKKTMPPTVITACK